MSLHNIWYGIKDSVLEPQIRGHAITILASFLDHTDASFYQSLLQHENDNFVIEKLNWALEWGMDKPKVSVENEHV